MIRMNKTILVIIFKHGFTRFNFNLLAIIHMRIDRWGEAYFFSTKTCESYEIQAQSRCQHICIGMFLAFILAVWFSESSEIYSLLKFTVFHPKITIESEASQEHFWLTTGMVRALQPHQIKLEFNQLWLDMSVSIVRARQTMSIGLSSMEKIAQSSNLIIK